MSSSNGINGSIFFNQKNSIRKEIIILDEIQERKFYEKSYKSYKSDKPHGGSSALCSNSHSTNTSMTNESPSSFYLNSINTHRKFSMSNFNIEFISERNQNNNRNYLYSNIFPKSNIFEQELNSYKIQNENLKLQLNVIQSENEGLKSKLKLAIENVKFKELYIEKCHQIHNFEKLFEENNIKLSSFLDKINIQNSSLVKYRSDINSILSDFIESFSQIRDINPNSNFNTINKNNSKAVDDFYINSPSTNDNRDELITTIKKKPTIREEYTHTHRNSHITRNGSGTPTKLNTITKQINFNDIKSINSEKVIFYFKETK
jgi:hypothetical protein